MKRLLEIASSSKHNIFGYDETIILKQVHLKLETLMSNVQQQKSNN